MQHLIKAGSFKRFVDRFGAYFVGLAFISLLIALYYALIKSPPDYQQGETVRIMYIHVPSAWLALGIYFGIAMSSLSYLVWRNPLSAIFIKSLIPIGMSFCLICLITGMLWGRPIWGVYWVWDARLTSVLILFFLYIGLYVLGNSISDKARSVKAIAIVAILGSVNLPIIRFSVKWWNTLHQPASIMRMDKPAIHSDILIPLLTTFVAMLLVTFSIFIYKASAEILESKTRRIISL